MTASPPTDRSVPIGATSAPGGVAMRPFDPRLLRVLPAARGPVVVLAAVTAMQGLVAIAQALATAALVVAVVDGQPLGRIGALVAVLFGARGILTAAVERLGAGAGVTVSTSLRGRAVAATLARPAGRRPGPASMVSLLDQGPTAVEPYVARYLPALVAAVVVPVAAIVSMMVLDWRIALIPILTVPLLPVFAALIGAATSDEAARRWAALATLSGHFLDVMRGLVTLVNYGRAERQAGTIRDVSERLRTTTVATLRLAFLSAAALELLASLSVAIVAVFVGLALADGRMALAVGLPLILLAPEAYWPLRRVGTEFHAAADGAAALDDLLGLAEEEGASRAAEPSSGPRADAQAPVVRLDQVAIGHERVLASVDRVLPVGLTAVVGPSGVGKSTLLEIVAGVRDPLAGHVAAPAVHMVGQRPFLVHGDLATNLSLGCDPAPDDDAMAAALRRVGLADVVAELPAGLASPLGDDGLGLSAGQRSRLALARGLLSDARVLVCDEPTAHQDDAAAARVRTILVEEATDRIVVVATHDHDLLAGADHVIALGAGPASSPDHTGVGVDGSPAISGVAASTAAMGRRAETVDVDRAAPSEGPATADGSTPVGGRARPDGVAAGDTAAPSGRGDAHDPRAVTAIGAGRDVVAAGLVGGLARACGVALTATSGWLVVAASLEPEILVLLVAIVLVRAFGIARPVLRWWERVRSHDAALADLARRREDLWSMLVPLAPARLGAHGRARLLTSMVDDLDDVVSAQVRVVVPGVAIAMAAVIGVGVAAWALPAATPWVAALAVALAGVAAVDLAVERRTQAGVVTARSSVAGVVTLVADQAVAIRGLGPGGPAMVSARLARAQHGLRDAVGSQAWARALGVGLVPVVVVAATLALAAVAQAAVAAGLPTPLAALIVLLPLGLGEAVGSDLAAAAGEWARARAAGQRVATVVDQAPAVGEPDTPVVPAAGSTRLQLEGVAARWNEESPLLSAPNLDLVPGLHIGLVGPNGSGKSTTMAVLARHLDPARGTYEINGTEVRLARLAAVRSRLAIVDDEPHVFASTVRNNLLLAAPGADDEHLEAALVTAGLGDWVAALPDGLATVVGAGGRGMSGGERSRLAVARAVASRRPVVVLDEPVAHLDHATAMAVMADVGDAFASASLVVAMHRPEGLDALDAVVALAPQAAADSVGRPDTRAHARVE